MAKAGEITVRLDVTDLGTFQRALEHARAEADKYRREAETYRALVAKYRRVVKALTE